MNITTIELHKEDMKFSAGHYTIFSATHREKLHGHNFRVYAAITAKTNENGMAFDYAVYKKKIRNLCQQLNNFFLIAGNSPYQTIHEENEYTYIHFANEKIPFLTKDILILPIKNITVEELSSWFIQQLTSTMDEIKKHAITELTVKVYTGPGQSGSTSWSLNEPLGTSQ